jgi:hypothetical protein
LATTIALGFLMLLAGFGAWLSYTESLYLKQQSLEFGEAIPDVGKWLVRFRLLTVVCATLMLTFGVLSVTS